MGCHWASSEAARRIIILFGGLDKVEIKKIKTMNASEEIHISLSALSALSKVRKVSESVQSEKCSGHFRQEGPLTFEHF
jgi:hypothetical protein